MTFSFKTKSGLWLTVKVIVDGTEPSLYNDFSNTIHCSREGLGNIEAKHESGQGYREIIEGLAKLSDVEI